MDEENVWYLQDEVGSAMKHSDEPNVAVHPFIYSPNNKLDEQTITYSVRLTSFYLTLDMLALERHSGR